MEAAYKKQGLVFLAFQIVCLKDPDTGICWCSGDKQGCSVRGKRKIDLIHQYYQNIPDTFIANCIYRSQTKELECLPTLVPGQSHEAPDVTILQLALPSLPQRNPLTIALGLKSLFSIYP